MADMDSDFHTTCIDSTDVLSSMHTGMEDQITGIDCNAELGSPTERVEAAEWNSLGEGEVVDYVPREDLGPRALDEVTKRVSTSFHEFAVVAKPQSKFPIAANNVSCCMSQTNKTMHHRARSVAFTFDIASCFRATNYASKQENGLFV